MWKRVLDSLLGPEMAFQWRAVWPTAVNVLQEGAQAGEFEILSGFVMARTEFWAARKVRKLHPKLFLNPHVTFKFTVVLEVH